MVSRTPPGNYQRYLDSNKAPNGIGSGEMEYNVNEKEKTDNYTSRTNNDQPDYNTRYIPSNHNALFGYYPKDGYILPGRTLNAERRNEFETAKKPDKPAEHDKRGEDTNKLDTDRSNTYKNGGVKPEDYTALRRGIDSAQDRLAYLNNKVEALDSESRHIPQRVGQVATDMATQGRQVDDLQNRNKLVSAKIHELERELKEVQLENRTIKGQLQGSDYKRGGYDPIPEQYGDAGAGGDYAPRYYDAIPPQDRQDRHTIYTDQAKDRFVRGKDGAPNRIAKNDQFSHSHAGRMKDEAGNSYYGLNKLYDPKILTSYRNEQVPYLVNQAERVKDENKFFHHPSDRHPGSYYYQGHQERHEPVKGLELDTTYKVKYSDPMDDRSNSSAGGICMVRYHEGSSGELNTAVHLLQQSLRVMGARVLGIASSRNVIVLEGTNGWRITKGTPRPQLQKLREYSNVVDEMLVFWFPSRERAVELFRSERNNNRFKGDIHFLHPYGFELNYLQLNVCPGMHLDSFLVLEIPYAKWYDSQKHEKENYQGTTRENHMWFDLQNFEVTSRELIQRYYPGALPNFSCVTIAPMNSIEGLKPGAIFKQGSRVFISAFEYLADIAEIWDELKGLMDAHKIQRDYQAFAFSTKDHKEEFQTFQWH